MSEQQSNYTGKEAWSFLTAMGLKIGKSKIYSDISQGKIPVQLDKTILHQDLLDYAESLKPAHGGGLSEIEKLRRSQTLFSEFVQMLLPHVKFSSALDTKIEQWLQESSAFISEKKIDALRKVADVARATEKEKNASHDFKEHLRGIAEGIGADGKIVQSEAEFLQEWLINNAGFCATHKAAQRLQARVTHFLEEGSPSGKKSRELFDVLYRLVLPGVTPPDPPCESSPSTFVAPCRKNCLPPSDPYKNNSRLELVPPRNDIFDEVDDICFESSHFCFTGIFAFGDREACAEHTAFLGGGITKYPRKYFCYVIVGSIASPAWLHGDYGTKIEKALSLRKEGYDVRILSEDTWAAELTKQTQRLMSHREAKK